MPESKTSPRRLQAAERRRKATELRKLGLSYQKIGQALGVSRQAAYKAVQTELSKIEQESAENTCEARRLELERLDEWQVHVEREMKNGKALSAIDRGLKIMDRRSKLLRLDPVPLQGRASRPQPVSKQHGDTAR